MTLLLVRHASAGSRDGWDGDDLLRPLDDRGRAQAEALVELLAPYPLGRILSSPATRCVDTVAPLADARALRVEVRNELREERQEDDGIALVGGLLGGGVAVSGHGGLESALGIDVRWRKGDVLVLDDSLRVVETLQP